MQMSKPQSNGSIILLKVCAQTLVFALYGVPALGGIFKAKKSTIFVALNDLRLTKLKP